jgi:hypothetical protein
MESGIQSLRPVDTLTFSEAITRKDRLESQPVFSSADLREIKRLNDYIGTMSDLELHCDICGAVVGTVSYPPSAEVWDYDSDMCMDCSVSWEIHCANNYCHFLDQWAAFCSAN